MVRISASDIGAGIVLACPPERKVIKNVADQWRNRPRIL